MAVDPRVRPLWRANRLACFCNARAYLPQLHPSFRRCLASAALAFINQDGIPSPPSLPRSRKRASNLLWIASAKKQGSEPRHTILAILETFRSPSLPPPQFRKPLIPESARSSDIGNRFMSLRPPALPYWIALINLSRYLAWVTNLNYFFGINDKEFREGDGCTIRIDMQLRNNSTELVAA